jgi:uncharacterized protein (DUF1499 family)
MKRMVPIALTIACCLVLGVVVLLAAFSLLSRRPDNLGVKDGRLAPCPASPNCVSSQADPGDAEHRIEPLAFDGTPVEALNRIQAILATLPRVRIVSVTDNYLHVEFTSLLFRFVDDVEFYADPAARCVHLRSASRAGRSDLGVNRRRMESFRQAFAARG